MNFLTYIFELRESEFVVARYACYCICAFGQTRRYLPCTGGWVPPCSRVLGCLYDPTCGAHMRQQNTSTHDHL